MESCGAPNGTFCLLWFLIFHACGALHVKTNIKTKKISQIVGTYLGGPQVILSVPIGLTITTTYLQLVPGGPLHFLGLGKLHLELAQVSQSKSLNSCPYESLE